MALPTALRTGTHGCFPCVSLLMVAMQKTLRPFIWVPGIDHGYILYYPWALSSPL